MDARTSTLSRICSSPIEAVFRAWTDPDAMQRFWTADPNWAIGDVRVDARRGGFYRVEFGLAGAKPLVDYGEFLTFDPPHSLTYSEQVIEDDVVMHGPTPCEVKFREVDRNRTGVSVTWTLDPDEFDPDELDEFSDVGAFFIEWNLDIRTGVDFLETLRGDERTSATPILMMSNEATEGKVRAAIRSGADSFISKPIDLEEIAIRLNPLLLARQKAMASKR